MCPGAPRRPSDSSGADGYRWLWGTQNLNVGNWTWVLCKEQQVLLTSEPSSEPTDFFFKFIFFLFETLALLLNYSSKKCVSDTLDTCILSVWHMHSANTTLSGKVENHVRQCWFKVMSCKRLFPFLSFIFSLIILLFPVGYWKIKEKIFWYIYVIPDNQFIHHVLWSFSIVSTLPWEPSLKFLWASSEQNTPELHL